MFKNLKIKIIFVKTIKFFQITRLQINFKNNLNKIRENIAAQKMKEVLSLIAYKKLILFHSVIFNN
jgi:hypothetical protein